jgi:hypothetical protein
MYVGHEIVSGELYYSISLINVDEEAMGSAQHHGCSREEAWKIFDVVCKRLQRWGY